MHPSRLLWEKYRQKRRLRPSRLGLELVMRKSVRDTVKEYLGHCSIAGIKNIREDSIDLKRRLVYAAIFFMSCGVLLYVLRWTFLQTFSGSPLVITPESPTYPIKMLDFPAVALCNVNRISYKALKLTALKIYKKVKESNQPILIHLATNPDFNLNFMIHYFRQYGQLIDFSYSEDLVTLSEVEFGTPQSSHRIIKLMEELAPDCEEMLLRCAWAGRLVNCTDLFTVRRTSMGHCCVFNYVLDHNSAGSFERATIDKVKRQNERGPIHGLHVLLDPLIEDYAYPTKATTGFDIFLFDPKNYPDPSGGRVIHRAISPNEVSYLELQSVKQITAAEVRHYPKRTRRCLFHNDEFQSFRGVYSYSTCIVNCRIRSVKTLCKCIPFYLPISIDAGFVCTLEQLRCLNKYKEKLLYQYPNGVESNDGLEMEVEDALFCPECLPDCEFTQHYSKAFKTPLSLVKATDDQFRSKEHRDMFSKNFNLTNKCILSVYQSTGDGDLIRLNVVNYWFEILSNIGGYAGILLGLSIISALEIIYFVIIRCPLLLYQNYRKYY